MVTSVGGEVLFKNRHGARESHMSAATEQGDSREAEDGGHQRGIGDSSQTLDAAFEAAWTQRRENTAVMAKMSLAFMSTTHEQSRPSVSTSPLMLYAYSLNSMRATGVAVIISYSVGEDPGAPRGNVA